MALPDLTGQNIQDTYQRVLQVGDDGTVYNGTGSIVPTLKMTASFALTEVNIETSSSYAQTASVATSIANGVHSLTSAEVNQLKNINSKTISNDQWGYVGNMNQNVRNNDTPTFLQVKPSSQRADTPAILFSAATGISGMKHLSVAGDESPGMTLGTSEENIVTFINGAAA